MTTSAASSATRSNSLQRLLVRLRREARAWIWVESLALAALAAAALGGGLFAIDWLLEPPAWARGLAATAAAGLLVWLLATRLVGRLATPLPDAALARAIERRHPAFGDTLSTAVELAAAERRGVDPALVTRTVAEAEVLAGRARTAAVFRRGRLGGIALAGVLAVVTVWGVAARWPEMARIWGRRILLLEDVSWPRQVSLEAEGFTAGVRKVPRGSDVEVVVRARSTGPLPESVYLRSLATGGWQSVRMGTRGGVDAGGQQFGHVLERVMTDTNLEIRGGDGRLRGLVLEAVDPPALADTSVQITLPPYLGGGRRNPPALRVVPVPRGSAVKLRFQATKPLAAATVTARSAAGDGAGRVIATLPAADAATAPVDRQSSPDSISAVIEPLDADTVLGIAFTDHDGISNQEPLTLLVSAVPDEPPTVTMRLSGISTAVTPEAGLPLAGSIADDHGLAAAAVEVVRGDDLLVAPISAVTGDEPLVELPAAAPVIVPLEPLALAAGDRLEVRVTATDACGLAGGPNTGTSETWMLEVITPDALRAMLEAREVLLRRRYEAAIEDLAQTRPSLGTDAVPNQTTAAGRIGEAAARAVGESQEIAAAFRGIRAELDHNSLLTPEIETRLIAHVAEPVAAIARTDLTELQTMARTLASHGSDADDAATELTLRTDTTLARMREVLTRMLELESYNELIEKLRGVIDSQEQIRADTLERQRRRAREALEAP
jgi:hypothetical protein